MPAPRPLWRRAFDAVEHPLGDALTSAAQSGPFGDAVALGLRLQRRMMRDIERRSRRVLHLYNLPAATDVRRLSQQVAELQRQVRALQHDLDRREVRRGQRARAR